MSDPGVPLHGRDPRFWNGVRDFDAGAYFAAHEAWERVWLEAEGEEKKLLAGLIQAAVGLLKLATGKPAAGRRLLGRARAKLATAEVETPVDVAALLEWLDADRAVFAEGAPRPSTARPLVSRMPPERCEEE